LLVWGSSCWCFVRSLPHTVIHREGTCFEDLHMSAHSDHGHVQPKNYAMFHSYVPSQCPPVLALSCSTCVILHASSVVPVSSACIGIMHLHARIGEVHVYARIPSLACLCTCRLVSRAERGFAFRCLYQGTRVYLHRILGHAELAICLLVKLCFIGLTADLLCLSHPYRARHVWV
jgi:hypothetical protein